MPSSLKNTSWPHVVLAFFAGCTIAIHIGKLPGSIPTLIDELQTSLQGVGMVVAAFSLITGLIGLLIGCFSDRIGHQRAALLGLLICATGSLLGAMSTSLSAMLLTRVIEGLGYILAATSLPALIAGSSTDHDRPLALGLWGAFVPIGMGVMLLMSPWLLDRVGWRGLWIIAGITTLILGLWIGLAFRSPYSSAPEQVNLSRSLRMVGQRAPLCLFGCFAAYSAQFIAVTSFLPKMFVDQYQIAIPQAATLGALVVMANIVGNLASGWLLRHGWQRHRLLIFAAAITGLCTLVIFNNELSLTWRFLAAVSFSAIGGLIPGTLAASAPFYIQHPGQMASMMGFLMQGAGAGQILGPILLTSLVIAFGAWEYSLILTLTAAALGIGCGLLLNKPTAIHANTQQAEISN